MAKEKKGKSLINNPQIQATLDRRHRATTNDKKTQHKK